MRSHEKISSDWIAVSVLRNVALSTNSVAASVEPVMQQQFFSMSPMSGQENFTTMDVRPSTMMAHTPTTSSMLAALQSNDPFAPTSLDPATAFNSDAFGTMSYMDPSGTPDDTLPSTHQAGLAYADFTSPANSYDVPGFPHQDMSLNSATPGSESDHDSEPIKTEQSQGL